jgi:hypothetical protein
MDNILFCWDIDSDMSLKDSYLPTRPLNTDQFPMICQLTKRLIVGDIEWIVILSHGQDEMKQLSSRCSLTLAFIIQITDGWSPIWIFDGRRKIIYRSRCMPSPIKIHIGRHNHPLIAILWRKINLFNVFSLFWMIFACKTIVWHHL